MDRRSSGRRSRTPTGARRSSSWLSGLLRATPPASLTAVCRAAAKSSVRVPEARCVPARFVRSSPGSVGLPLVLRGIGPPHRSVNGRFLWRHMSPPLPLCPHFVRNAVRCGDGTRNPAEFLDSSICPAKHARHLSSYRKRIESISGPRQAFLKPVGGGAKLMNRDVDDEVLHAEKGQQAHRLRRPGSALRVQPSGFSPPGCALTSSTTAPATADGGRPTAGS